MMDSRMITSTTRTPPRMDANSVNSFRFVPSSLQPENSIRIQAETLRRRRSLAVLRFSQTKKRLCRNDMARSYIIAFVYMLPCRSRECTLQDLSSQGFLGWTCQQRDLIFLAEQIIYVVRPPHASDVPAGARCNHTHNQLCTQNPGCAKCNGSG